MKITIFTIVLSLAVGFAAAAWFGVTEPVQVPADNGQAEFDPAAPLGDRIRALEHAVSDERLARQLLQEEVFYLTSELERLAEPGADSAVRPETSTAEEARSASSRREDSRRRRASREGRVEALVEAGFLPGQADWIAQREQELQMQALQARFDAERSGEEVDWMANRTLTSDTLREELGDADYERYLEATGRSTTVSVSSIIESSPAQTAGLMPGDEIYRYDGERVFSMTDLTRRTMVGEPGQTVVVDIMRNGNLVQVVMPRGPVGITGGRRRF